MNCKNCGYSILPGESFCTQCGTPVNAGGVDTPATTTTTTTSGYSPLLGIGVLVLVILQALMWFVPTINREFLTTITLAMGIDVLQDVAWTMVCVLVCMPLLIAAAISTLKGVARKENKGAVLSMVASIANVVGMIVYYYGCTSSEYQESISFTGMGYLQMVLSVICIVLCLIEIGTIKKPSVKTLTTKPTATDYEKTVDYSSAPEASVGGSVGGDYYPSAPVSAGKTVKCHLCDFDVPFGESYCTRCGTTIVEPTMRVPSKAAPAAPVTPVAPTTPAAPSAPSGLKGTAASATPVSAPAPKPAPKPSAPKAPPAGFGHCDDLD